MKKLITSLLAICLLVLPAAAQEFALHKAAISFASEAGATRTVSRGTNEFNQSWYVAKYSFEFSDPDAIKPLIAAYDKDLDNKKVTLAIQQAAPFAFSIVYNQADAPIKLESPGFYNILLIAGQESQKGDMPQIIVAVVWIAPDEDVVGGGEIYIIERDPMCAAINSNIYAQQPQTISVSDNVMRLQFYSKAYQESSGFMRSGANIVSAVAMVVPEIVSKGDPAEIEAAKNCLAEMIAFTPGPENFTSQSLKNLATSCASTLLDLIHLLSTASGASQMQVAPGNFAIIGDIDPELWDIGYYIANNIDQMSANPVERSLTMATGRSFAYKTELTEISVGRLQALFNDGTICNAWIQFPFVPGETAYLTVHNGTFSLSGSGFYDQYSAAQKLISVSSADSSRIYKYAKEHIGEPGAVCAVFISNKLTPAQLRELYDLIPAEYKSNYVGTFLRRFL